MSDVFDGSPTLEMIGGRKKIALETLGLGIALELCRSTYSISFQALGNLPQVKTFGDSHLGPHLSSGLESPEGSPETHILMQTIGAWFKPSVSSRELGPGPK
jgi:hypothetical protein